MKIRTDRQTDRTTDMTNPQTGRSTDNKGRYSSRTIENPID